MADLTPIPSIQRPSDPGYQPVSGYAVASAIVAGMFIAFLVAVLVAALGSHRFAMTWELLALPIAGVILAAVSRSQIRNSEGTRTGVRLATVSWWICVLGGVGFAAYIYANSVALELESGKFADQMFRELQAGKVQEAFENHLVPPEERGRVPANAAPELFEAAYAPSGYTSFRNHDVVRLFARNGQSVEFERLRVKDSGQEPAGLYATHIYRLKCPEGIFECSVKTVAAEAKKGGKPLWRIPAQPLPSIGGLNVVQLSQYGRATSELSQEGENYIRNWISHVSNGHRAWVHVLTTPRDHRDRTIKDLNWLIGLGGAPALDFPVGPGVLPPDRAAAWEARARLAEKGDAQGPAALDLPFEDLAGIGFFRRDDSGTPLADDRLNQLRDIWRLPKVPNMVASDNRAASMDSVLALAPITILKPDRIIVIHAADLFVDRGAVHSRCAIAAECTDPALLAAINAARDRGASANDDGSFTLRTLPARDWRVIWLKTDMEPLAPPAAPGR